VVGEGSLEIAHGLYEKGIPVIGVPKTIDNDMEDRYYVWVSIRL
jgi:6-phosphofructokinase 1